MLSEKIQKTYRSGQGFLEGLRRSNDKRKKTWLTATSSVAMVLVIGLWLLYLNVSIPSLKPEEKTVVENQKESSFFKTLGRGLSVITAELFSKTKNFRDQISGGFSKLKVGLRKTNEISFEASQINFVFKSLEPIPPTKLP